MTNVIVTGRGTHNLLLIATVNDTVYAFDADDPTVTTPYWTRSFINPPNIVAPKNTDMTGACGGSYHDFSGNMGIVGAPVIDPVTSTMYLVVRTKESGTSYVQRLHALDVATGNEQPNSPVIIAATNGVAFDPYKQNQRAGLLLVNGYVYITWSSHCDWPPYHGWVIGYNTANFSLPPLTFNATPSGSQAGVWMSNQAASFRFRPTAPLWAAALCGPPSIRLPTPIKPLSLVPCTLMTRRMSRWSFGTPTC